MYGVWIRKTDIPGEWKFLQQLGIGTLNELRLKYWDNFIYHAKHSPNIELALKACPDDLVSFDSVIQHWIAGY